MLNFDPQTIVVALIVLAATIYLLFRARKYVRPAKNSAGCATGCGHCPSNAAGATKADSLLQLDSRKSS
jgi:hypothetical protein